MSVRGCLHGVKWVATFPWLGPCAEYKDESKMNSPSLPHHDAMVAYTLKPLAKASRSPVSSFCHVFYCSHKTHNSFSFLGSL